MKIIAFYENLTEFLRQIPSNTIQDGKIHDRRI